MLDTTDPSNGLPDWLGPVLGAIFGAGGVKMLSVWLENRRLAKKEYRQTLLEQITQQAGRISELETCIAGLQVRVGNLRVEVAHLEAENETLRRECGLPPRKMDKEQDDEKLSRGESHED